ncbi:MAG: DUF3553 domain-containing protein [Rhodospirillales bacterium]|nr:DUF3553 domain-containing protein [Rhodospirillales bacterium]
MAGGSRRASKRRSVAGYPGTAPLHANPPPIRGADAAALEPGQWVRLPARPDWGAGQVQTVDGLRVTVMFEHGGKVLVNLGAATLEALDGPP